MTAALTAGTPMKPTSIGATNAGRCFVAIAVRIPPPCSSGWWVREVDDALPAIPTILH